MELVITEKPDVAEELVKAISQNYQVKDGYYICVDLDVIVTFAFGNLLGLADPEYFDKSFEKWDRDKLPMSWPVKFIPNPKTSKQLKIIGTLLNKCNSISNACDIDSSGNFIFFSIIEHFSKLNMPIKRVFVNDNNLIKRAWDNREISVEAYNDSLTEKARAIADMHFGYNLTRALTTQCQYQGWSKLLTAGRVQSCIIGVVVRREIERNDFISYDFFTVSVDIDLGGVDLKGIKYINNEDDHVDEHNRIINKDYSDGLVTTLLGKGVTLGSIEKKQTETNRPLPYDLASLQGDCDRLFNYSLSEVLKITQSLRQNKMCTYNRTDSRYLSDEAFYDAPALLSSLSQVEMFKPIIELCVVDESNISRCFSSKNVSAHHAIIPTNNPTKIGELTEAEFNVYFLIVRNYLIQFMSPEIKERVTLEFSAYENDKDMRFKISKSRQLQSGWQIFFSKEPKPESSDSNIEQEETFDFDMNLLKEGHTYNIVDCKTSQAATTPPPFYTITTLLNAIRNTVNLVEDEEIKKMLLAKDVGSKDRGGIGTAATRTPILTEIFKKQLLKKQRNMVRITEASVVLYNALPESVTSPITTAIWANQQAQILLGELSVEEFVEGVKTVTEEAVNEIKKGINIPDNFIKPLNLVKCPCCSELSAEERTGKAGIYWLCKPCGKTFPDYENAPFDNETMSRHSEKCPTCTGIVEKFDGRYGSFWKCVSGDCGNFTELDGKPFYQLCPKCNNKLKIVKPKVQKGKKTGGPFISCSGYPSCDYKLSLNPTK